MVGCGGQWSSGPLNFQCCFPATRSCQAQGATWGIPAASTMFHRDGWGRGFVFSTGFSCNEHRLLWLECCYWPFMTCLHCCCICWSKVGYGRLKGYKFMNLQLFFFFPIWWWGLLYYSFHPLHHFSAPVPELNLEVYLPLRLECSLWPAQYRL